MPRDVLREEDGQMHIHGIQRFDGSRVTVPGREDHQPNRDFLAEGYELFRLAS